jgi:hypothetical protein
LAKVPLDTLALKLDGVDISAVLRGQTPSNARTEILHNIKSLGPVESFNELENTSYAIRIRDWKLVQDSPCGWDTESAMLDDDDWNGSTCSSALQATMVAHFYNVKNDPYEITTALGNDNVRKKTTKRLLEFAQSVANAAYVTQSASQITVEPVWERYNSTVVPFDFENCGRFVVEGCSAYDDL